MLSNRVGVVLKLNINQSPAHAGFFSGVRPTRKEIMGKGVCGGESPFPAGVDNEYLATAYAKHGERQQKAFAAARSYLNSVGLLPNMNNYIPNIIGMARRHKEMVRKQDTTLSGLTAIGLLRLI